MCFVILYFQTTKWQNRFCTCMLSFCIFKNFLFLKSCFERWSMTGTNESKLKEVSWVFSLINVVIIVSCFILHTFSYFSRTYFILIVYFIPSVISRFVKIMVSVCNPQNCIKFKLAFMFLWESLLWSLTNSKPSNCKKFYFLFKSFFFSCQQLQM